MRLPAEAVRDAMLAVSGQLNASMYGPSFRPFKIVKNAGSYHSYEPVDSAEPDQQRRTIYRMNVNSGGNPLLDALDCPVPSVKTPQRSVTTTPLQSLSLMNNPFVQRQAKALAERLSKESTDTVLASAAWLPPRVWPCSRNPRNSLRQFRWSNDMVLSRSVGAYSIQVSSCMSTDPGITRRRLLLDSGRALVGSRYRGSEQTWAAAVGTAFRAKVKRVVQVFCVGGMSHVDTFDYKPELSRRNGQPFEMPTFFGQAGNLLGQRFRIQAAWTKWALGQRVVAQSGAMRRQTDRHSHHGLQEREPYACGCANEYGLHSYRIPEHGRLGGLRARV